MPKLDPQLYDAAGRIFDIDPALLRAVARVESGEEINIHDSSAGARGPMQFIPGTARQFGISNPRDPKQAVFGAAAYLRTLIDNNNGDVPRALQQYNGATGDRTQKYTRQVFANYQPFNIRSDASPDAPTASAAKPPAASAAAATPTAQPVAQRMSPDEAQAELDNLLGGGKPAKPAAPAAKPAATPEPAAAAAAPARMTPEEADAEVTSLVGDAKPAAAPAATTAPVGKPPVTGGATDAAGQPVLGLDALSPYVPPVLGTTTEGVGQGVRDVGQTVAGWNEDLNRVFPPFRAVDYLLGKATGGRYTPEAATESLRGQTAAYEQAHGDDPAAGAGRVIGNILATAPLLAQPEALVARGVGAATNAARLTPWVGRVLQGEAAGATAAGGTAALTSGPSGQNALAAAAEAAPVGAVLGGAGPFVAGGTRAALGGGRPVLEEIAQRLGIRLTTGQRMGGVMERIEDTTAPAPFSGAARAAADQRGDITKVIERNMGEAKPTGRLDTASINASQRRIGDDIEKATGQITIPGNDQKLLNDLTQIDTNARVAGPATPEAHTAKTLIDRVLNTISNSGGNIPGPELQKFIARGGELDKALNHTNGDVRGVAKAIREALFDAAGRGGQGSAQAFRDLQQARYQWKVSETVRDAIDRPPGGSEEMSLPRLAQAIRREFNTRQFGPGADMQDLAKLIEGVKPIRSSGTAERLLWQGLTGLGVSGTGAGGIYYGLQHPEDWETGLYPLAGQAAAIAAGRYSRLGAPAIVRATNPLAARAAGSFIGNPQGQQRKP